MYCVMEKSFLLCSVGFGTPCGRIVYITVLMLLAVVSVILFEY